MPQQEVFQNDCEACGVLLAIHRGMLVVRPLRSGSAPVGRLANRGAIKEFSPASGIRMRRYLRDCTAEYRSLVTLTYPHGYPIDGRVCKAHLKRFIQELRRYDREPDRFSVFWFLEYQNRGAPHFHMFVTGFFPKEFIASTWFRIVGSDDARHLHAGTRIEKIRAGRGGMSQYASKYAAKMEQKSVPKEIINCGRFWGVSGLKETVSATIVIKPDARSLKPIDRALNTLKSEINIGKESGAVKELPKRGCFGARVFITNAESVKSTWRGIFYRLEALIAASDVGYFLRNERHEREMILSEEPSG